MSTHLHFDLVGGAAGDMIAAALLDAAPELLSEAEQIALQVLGDAGQLQVAAHKDAVFRGLRFNVLAGRSRSGEKCTPRRRHGHPAHAHHGDAHDHDHAHHGDHEHDHQAVMHAHAHHHRTLAEVSCLLDAAGLQPGANARAKDIYRRLAEAEARVHGVSPAEVHFHELGELDSILDAAVVGMLLDRLVVTSASVGPVPHGGGYITTAHGKIPAPAPATLELLRGFTFHSDGVQGERVTPTGAAILAHLSPEQDASPSGSLRATGYGFGARELPQLSNVLRVSVFETANLVARERVAVLEFEIDDQTAEDLAIGLDRVRSVEGVLDVAQWAVLGKKGRLGAHVQVLCHPDAQEAAAAKCLSETATLGVRMSLATRKTLPRTLTRWRDLQVKEARLETGETKRKLESDDLAASGRTYVGRQTLAARMTSENSRNDD